MAQKSKTDRITEWLNGGKAAPWTVQIQPSNSCNSNCLFCCRRFEKARKDKIPDKRLLEIVQEAHELGVRQVELTGMRGDPMIRKVAYKVMKEIKKYGMFGNLLTNGTLFSSRQIKGLVEMGWDTIVFSLDGPNPEINDYIRGKGVFEKVTNAIKEIDYWKDRVKSDKPTLLFLTVLTSLNFNKIEDMTELAHSLGVRHVQVRPMIVHENSKGELDSLKLNEKQIPYLISNIKKAEKIAKNCGVVLSLEHKIETLTNYVKSGYKRDLPKKFDDRLSEGGKKAVEKNVPRREALHCLLPFSEMVIFAEGTVSPCCLIWGEEHKGMCDSVLEKKLGEVWYGNHFDSFRLEIKKGRLPAPCHGCFL